MFKYFHDSPQEESVYNLVANNQVGPNGHAKHDKKARYRSIYSGMVRQEFAQQKNWPAKTMGVPRIPVEEPDNFLKKHSKRPLSLRPKSVPPGTGIPSLLSRDKECQTVESDEGQPDKAIHDDTLEEGTKIGKEISVNQTVNSFTNRSRPKTCHHHERGCLSTTRKPPIPCSNLGVDVVVQETKDFVKANAMSTIGSRPDKQKNPLYVDTVQGDKKQWLNSGLAPHYVHQKKFAHVPVYITVRKKEFLEQLKKRQEEEENKRKSSHVRILNKEEKDKIIEGLHQNWDEIFSYYQRLPLLIDTPGKIKRKTNMEEQLKKIETDIQTLQRHDSIYVSDIAPTSFYAFNNQERKSK